MATSIPAERTFDGIIVGAGHNALITAAYLARAGLKIAVFERRTSVGGAFCTEEVTAPGFKHNIHAVYLKIHDSPVQGDLQLGRHGVKYAFPGIKQSFIKHDSYCIFYRDVEATCAQLARYSPKDAATYRRIAPVWRAWYRDFTLPDMYSAPLAPDAWRDRLMKAPGGPEYYDMIVNHSPLEYAQSLFESDYGRGLVTRASVAAEYDITTKGIPTVVFATVANWVTGSTGVAIGGTRQVPLALARIVEEAGGRVFTGEAVGKILVDGNTARGIALLDGREFRAERFVASGLDPINTFLFMVGEDGLDETTLERVSNYKFNETSLFRVHMALKDRPRFKIAAGVKDLNDALLYTVGYEDPAEMTAFIRQGREGRVGKIVGVSVENVTHHDATQAPPGCHTGFMGIAAPFDLADGGSARWPDIANGVADQMFAKLAEYAPNMTPDKVIARFNYTPKDIEEYLPDMLQGDICQGKITPSQSDYERPWREISRYRTQIDKLYLCGACTHPGGHATGAPGYNAANAIAEDLGIEKWWPKYDPAKVLKAVDDEIGL